MNRKDKWFETSFLWDNSIGHLNLHCAVLIAGIKLILERLLLTTDWPHVHLLGQGTQSFSEKIFRQTSLEMWPSHHVDEEVWGGVDYLEYCRYFYILHNFGSYEEDVHQDDAVVEPDLLVRHFLFRTLFLFSERHRFIYWSQDSAEKESLQLSH